MCALQGRGSVPRALLELGRLWLRTGNDSGEIRIFTGLGWRAIRLFDLALLALDRFVLRLFLARLLFEAFVERYWHGAFLVDVICGNRAGRAWDLLRIRALCKLFERAAVLDQALEVA